MHVSNTRLSIPQLAPYSPLPSLSGFKFSQLEMSGYTLSVVVDHMAEQFAEIVLSVLLPNFSFELTDQPIVWNSSAVIYPTMGEKSRKPEMLLKVKAL